MDREQIVRSTCEYTFCTRSAQSQAMPLTAERAKGVYFWDADGKRMLGEMLDTADTLTSGR